MAISPNGKSAYVADTNGVWQYTINPTTGKLTPKKPATVGTGKGTHNIVIAPDGKNAYVITVSNDRIAQYASTRAPARSAPSPYRPRPPSCIPKRS